MCSEHGVDRLPASSETWHKTPWSTTKLSRHASSPTTSAFQISTNHPRTAYLKRTSPLIGNMTSLLASGSFRSYPVCLEDGARDLKVMREGMGLGRLIWFAEEHTASFKRLGNCSYQKLRLDERKKRKKRRAGSECV